MKSKAWKKVTIDDNSPPVIDSISTAEVQMVRWDVVIIYGRATFGVSVTALHDANNDEDATGIDFVESEILSINQFARDIRLDVVLRDADDGQQMILTIKGYRAALQHQASHLKIRVTRNILV